jgi:muramoyltetrapeptide carboxypeptidase
VSIPGNFPPFLREGDKILVLAPAFSANPAEVRAGVQRLQQRGFEVEIAPHVFHTWGKFAGTDSERLADMQWALDHPEARAILMTRGGYGMGRLVSDLDWAKFLQNPKWVIGFSDITLVHAEIQNRGFCSIHGPMAVHAARPGQQEAVDRLWNWLSQKETELRYRVSAHVPPTHPKNGVLVGGNLSMLAHLCGSQRLPKGDVLFLEEIGEPYYRIDRMLHQLRHSDFLSQFEGTVWGQISDCARDHFPQEPEHMSQALMNSGSWIFTSLPSGHGEPSFPLVLGASWRWFQDNNQNWMMELVANERLTS